MQSEIQFPSFTLHNDQPFVLFGGMNVLESRDMAMNIAETMVKETQRLGIPYVFKASFDKANRSSMHSYRGPGLDEGLKLLAEIKDTFQCPVITDVHEPQQAEVTAAVADVIQIPAFLCRQTDLVVAMAQTGAIINVKKAQFLAPHEMGHILKKIGEAGNDKVILCERGSAFGYNNLIVDMLSFGQMKQFDVPVMFDVTHSLQLPGARSSSADGRRSAVLQLAKAGISQKISSLFLEAHPDPDQAKCDGPCALPLHQVGIFLEQIKQIDDLIKAQQDLVIV